MTNYEYCVRWAIGQANNGDARVLDYGCGAGQIVRGLREQRVDAYGCDVFYEGGDYSESVDPGLRGHIIRRMQDKLIPFDDSYFDLVINNQVMEHVENLDDVLAEISRVLKPGGKCLSLFPDKTVWREGHCGVPFLHWFPKGSRPRVYYAAMFRLLGFGLHKEEKDFMRWSKEFCTWLDNWTWYRSLSEIETAYLKQFATISHIEDQWARERLERRGKVFAYAPHALQKWLVRKLCGLIFVCEKRSRRQPTESIS